MDEDDHVADIFVRAKRDARAVVKAVMDQQLFEREQKEL